MTKVTLMKILMETITREVFGVHQDGEEPVHCVVDEAYPNKVLVASRFTASGLRGLLKLFLPPFTAASSIRRKQQQIAIIGAIGKYLCLIEYR